MRVTVKIRHRHEGAAALIEKTGDDEILVTFDEPQRAVTPGQAAVFTMRCGGWRRLDRLKQSSVVGRQSSAKPEGRELDQARRSEVFC